jgi:hypothetical protein
VRKPGPAGFVLLVRDRIGPELAEAVSRLQ